MADEKHVVLITGASKGIGRYLAEYYVNLGFQVTGCSRGPSDYENENYCHFALDVCDEPQVKAMFSEIRKNYGQLRVLINNAGIAAMNHAILTPLGSVRKLLDTNVIGTFLFCREAVKLMKKKPFGRINKL